MLSSGVSDIWQLLTLQLKLGSLKKQIFFYKDLLKNIQTTEAKNTKFKQIGSEGHEKYDYAKSNVNREILKKKTVDHQR